MTGAESKRIFFALWPTERVRQQLAHCQLPALLSGPGSRFVADFNLHLTLHFVGSTSQKRLRCMQTAAAQVRAGSFDLVVDGVGYFKKAQVAWLGIRQPNGALTDLHRRLGSALGRCDYTPETRPYAPHITLARKITTEPPTVQTEPIPWVIRDFVLVESTTEPTGVRYSVLDRFPLQG